MAMIKEYFNLTEQYCSNYGTNTVLLMQVGSFFEVYSYWNDNTETYEGGKIEDFSRICDLAIAAKNVRVCEDKYQVFMAGFKEQFLEKYLKKLNDANYTAVVYTQDENVRDTTPKQYDSKMPRSLYAVFSPGTNFQYDTPNLTNNISCVWIYYVDTRILRKNKQIIIGVSNIDIFTGKTTIAQYQKKYIDCPTTYDELERFLSIYVPNEMILISNLPTTKAFKNVIHYASINCAVIHKLHVPDKCDLSDQTREFFVNQTKHRQILNCEKQKYQQQILTTFYETGTNFSVYFEKYREYDIATQSLCYLLEFVREHNPHLANKISEPVFENNSERLTLANHSLKQLHIIDDGTVKSNKFSCVSNCLNQCHTPMGKREFNNILLNPITNTTILNTEYNTMEHFIKSFEIYDMPIRKLLTPIKDLSKIERQICIQKIPPKSFYYLWAGTTNALELLKLFTNDIVLKTYLGKDISAIGEHLVNTLETIFDLSKIKDIDTMGQFETNFIKTGIDNELDKKHVLLIQSETELEKICADLNSLFIAKSGKQMDYVKINETEKNNVRLICTSIRSKLITDKQYTFTKQSSSSNSSNVIIHSTHIDEICDTIVNIKNEMKSLIYKAYSNIVGSLIEQINNINDIIQFLIKVDVLHSKCAVAKQYGYCKPVIQFGDTSHVDAKGLRHCLAERFQTDEIYIANDLELGETSEIKRNGILLFGTNAVGKTTLIRALGIAIVMAQSGMYVPCSSFTYTPYRQIFTRIIGNDNIFKGMSTFEVEMSELRTILNQSDQHSLVLGDELCSGTETMSAISIFVAGICELAKLSSSFIFATHLHEIVNYDEINNLTGVELKHMEVLYDNVSGKLIYDRKLKPGAGSNMYGLEVCKSLHFPRDFLTRANELRIKYSGEPSKNILSLKQSRYNAEKLVGMCEKCGKQMATETHHIYQQKDATSDGIIKTKEGGIIHKNTKGNLMALCEKCHSLEHI